MFGAFRNSYCDRAARWRIAIVVACSILAFPAFVTATEVLAVVTNDWIVFAADSLLNIREGTIARTAQSCKIHQRGPLFWAVAGVASDASTGYDVATFFDSKIIVQQPIDKVLDRIRVNDLADRLQREVPLIRDGAPDFYQRLINRGGTILTLAVVGRKKKRVVTYWKDFKLIGSRVIPQPTATCTPAKNEKACVELTDVPGLRQYVRSHPEIWNGNAVDIVDRMMQFGYQTDPEFIGPPATILAVTRDRSYWLRQNNCDDLKPK